MTSEEFAVVEAMINEKAREIAKTEISRALRRIGDEFSQAYLGGRFDNDESGVGNSMIAYLDGVFCTMADQT